MLTNTLVAPDRTGIKEEKTAKRTISARQRRQQFGREDQLTVTAETVIVAIARTDGRRFKAAHRTDTAGVEVLEEREHLVAVCVTVANLEVHAERPSLGEREVLRQLIGGTVVSLIPDRQSKFSRQALITTAGRRQHIVSRITRPTQGQKRGLRLVAIFINIAPITFRRIVVTITGMLTTAAKVNLRLFQSSTQENSIQFRHRDTKTHTGTDRFVSHVRNVELVQVYAAVVQVNVAADAFRRDIRFAQAHGVCTHTLGRVDFDTEGLARTEHVILREACRQDHTVGRGVTGTERDGTRRTFLHVDFEVNLVTRAFHRLGFGSHRIKVTQAVDTIA